MKPDDRRSINNAIWLCSNCSAIIDVDIASYSTALLHDWKRRAENAATAELGKQLPRLEDAQNAVAAVLGNAPATLRGSAIQAVHAAVQQRLNGVDPRIHVETSYANGVTTYSLHPKEPFDLSLRVDARYANDWRNAMRALLQDGKDVNLPAAGISIVGSKLFEELGSRSLEGSFHIAGQKRAAIAKMVLISPDGKQERTFDDCVGEVKWGTKTFSFQGKSCAGLIVFAFTIPLNPLPEAVQVSLGCDSSPWNGENIRRLPYFERVAAFFDLISRGWAIQFAVEIDGRQLFQGRSHAQFASEDLAATTTFLAYMRGAIVLTTHLGLEVRFALGHEVDVEDSRFLVEMADAVNRRVYRASDLVRPPRSTLTLGTRLEDALLAAADAGPSIAVLMQYSQGGLTLFGVPIALPLLEIQLDDVRPRVLEGLSAVKPGATVTVEWIPGPNFQCVYRFPTEEERRLMTPESDPVGEAALAEQVGAHQQALR